GSTASAAAATPPTPRASTPTTTPSPPSASSSRTPTKRNVRTSDWFVPWSRWSNPMTESATTTTPALPSAAPSPLPAIATHALTKRYGSLTALDSLDLVLEKGDVFGFIGPNGAGKSTTMKILAGLL